MNIAIGMNYRQCEDGTGRAYLDAPYYQALSAFGVQPSPLLPLTDSDYVDRCLNAAGGLLMTGGLDLNPDLWSEPRHDKTQLVHPVRQQFDFLLYDRAVKLQKPVLAICLGLQVICVAHGGSLYQHLPEEPGKVNHGTYGEDVYHELSVEGPYLSQWLNSRSIEVPSAHHQGVRTVGQGLDVLGRTADGVIEAVTRPNYPFLLAVQWHPERYYNKNRINNVIIESFLKACNENR